MSAYYLNEFGSCANESGKDALFKLFCASVMQVKLMYILEISKRKKRKANKFIISSLSKSTTHYTAHVPFIHNNVLSPWLLGKKLGVICSQSMLQFTFAMCSFCLAEEDDMCFSENSASSVLSHLSEELGSIQIDSCSVVEIREDTWGLPRNHCNRLQYLTGSNYNIHFCFKRKNSFLRGKGTPNQNLACFMLYLKIINAFLKNNTSIMKPIVWGTQKWH